MMTLKTLQESYQYHTQKVSDIVRQLALAAIGLIWLFKLPSTGSENSQLFDAPIQLHPYLLTAAMAIFVSLFVDLLHYTVGAGTWGIYHWLKDKEDIPSGSEFKAPGYLNYAPIVLFALKIVAMTIGYIFIFRFLYFKLG